MPNSKDPYFFLSTLNSWRKRILLTLLKNQIANYLRNKLPCHAIHRKMVELSPTTQYFLTANNTFLGIRGPSSWSTIFVFHLIVVAILFTWVRTSTLSRNMTAPSGRRILSISSRMSSALHLHWHMAQLATLSRSNLKHVLVRCSVL